MKKLNVLQVFMLVFCMSIITLSCSKEAPIVENNVSTKNGNTTSINFQKGIALNEYNIGAYHNQMIQYIIDDLESLDPSEKIAKINSSAYLSGKMKEFCIKNGFTLPSDSILNESLSNYEMNYSLEGLLNNSAFNQTQKQLLEHSFDAINSMSLNNYRTIIEELNSNIQIIKTHSSGKGKTISIAVINQLISSSELWIKDGNYGYFSSNSNSDQAKVLAADAGALGYALLFGGWTSPIGWCGAMFIGAGASIGAEIGSNWWPF